MQTIGIIDYHAGNIQSVIKKISVKNVSVIVTNNPSEISKCDKLILPGVGHFGNAMQKISSLNLPEALQEAVLIKKVPILGICLGMQLMTEFSEEGNVAGLGWIKGKIIRFNVNDSVNFKIPHTGWNTMQIQKDSLLLKDISIMIKLHMT